MNAYAAPTAGSTAEFDVDPREAVPPLLVRAGGFLLGASGFFMAGAGLQLVVFFYLTLGMKAVAVWLMALGVGAIGVSPWLVKGRSWAAVVGAPLAAVMALTAVVWTAYSLWQTLFSPLMILELGVALVTVLVVPFTILPAIRVSRARKALYA
jgi:multisubunit Na+/H+ antiporter MnhC subunit